MLNILFSNIEQLYLKIKKNLVLYVFLSFLGKKFILQIKFYVKFFEWLSTLTFRNVQRGIQIIESYIADTPTSIFVISRVLKKNSLNERKSK